MNKSSTDLKENYSNGQRNFQGYQLSGLDLVWVTLNGSDFRGADFYGANLSGANLRNTDFSGDTNLTFADLSRADLTESDLRGANLEGANLEGAILLDALYDEKTKFPKGFDPSIMGAIQFKKEVPQRISCEEPKPLDESNGIDILTQESIVKDPSSSSTNTTTSSTENRISYPPKESSNTVKSTPSPTKDTSLNSKSYNILIIIISGIISLFFGIKIFNSNTQNSSSINPHRQPETMDKELTQSETQSVIEHWLKSKSKIFAPPYDRQLLSEVTTGKLYEDVIAPGRGINWLIENNAYYQFDIQKVDSIQSLSILSPREAKINAVITEVRSLYINGRYDASKSEKQTSLTQFFLLKENGSWKISDYEDIR